MRISDGSSDVCSSDLDALVVGVPNEKWGRAVTAVVHLSGDIAFDEQAVKDHVRGQLAGYKTPKAIYPTNTPMRASNGKADYATAKAKDRKSTRLKSRN